MLLYREKKWSVGGTLMIKIMAKIRYKSPGSRRAKGAKELRNGNSAFSPISTWIFMKKSPSQEVVTSWETGIPINRFYWPWTKVRSNHKLMFSTRKQTAIARCLFLVVRLSAHKDQFAFFIYINHSNAYFTGLLACFLFIFIYFRVKSFIRLFRCANKNFPRPISLNFLSPIFRYNCHEPVNS